MLERRFDGFANLALCLAMFLMVLPVEAGILTGLFIQRRLVDAALLAACCFAIVVLPAIISWRRHHLNPNVWRGDWQLITTSIILVFNSLMVGSGFLKQWGG